jgi:hypothetical protein
MHLVTIAIFLAIGYFIYQFLFSSSKSTGDNNGNARRRPMNITRGRHAVHPQMVDQGNGMFLIYLVLSMFPDFTREIVELDLSRTGSVQATSDNILNGILIQVLSRCTNIT